MYSCEGPPGSALTPRVWGPIHVNKSQPVPQSESLSKRSICHDLKQYVSAALLVSTLPASEQLDQETQHRFDMITRQLSQMSSVLDDCLNDPAIVRVDNITALVHECVEAAGLRHHIDVIDELTHARLLGNPTALRRAITNVLDNAVRAAGEDRKVVVRVSGSDTQVIVEVRDTGVGFGRLHSGHGLGMSSVADALASFHGSLEICSGPGPGTLVRMILPRSFS
jgi:signal transduction histidine kinase